MGQIREQFVKLSQSSYYYYLFAMYVIASDEAYNNLTFYTFFKKSVPSVCRRSIC